MRKTSMALVTLLLVPAFTQAQHEQASWDNLKQLQPGQKIELVDAKMKTSTGKFVSVTEEAITLRDGKQETTVRRVEVARVSVGDNSHRTRNILLGAGIGGGIGIAATVVPLAASSNEGNGCAVCIAGIAAGFGGGTALGMIPGHRTIYRVKAVQASTARELPSEQNEARR